MADSTTDKEQGLQVRAGSSHDFSPQAIVSERPNGFKDLYYHPLTQEARSTQQQALMPMPRCMLHLRLLHSLLDQSPTLSVLDLRSCLGQRVTLCISDPTWPSTFIHMVALCTAGVHALGAAIDAEADRIAGQRTIAVVLGGRAAILFAASCYLIASTTVNVKSVFGVYVWVGLIIMLAPCVNIDYAHHAFRAIVGWSVMSSTLWIGMHVGGGGVH